MNNSAKIEALLFVAGEEGLSLSDLSALTELSQTACQQQIDCLTEKYAKDDASSLTIIKTAAKYRLTTKDTFAALLENYARTAVNQSLSKSAIEVLSIIAYKQPITRLEIDQLRSVGSSGVLSTLRVFDLIKVVGQLEVAGRPSLYATTDFFLDYIGINSLADLPPMLTQDFEAEKPNELFHKEDENLHN